MLFLLRLVFWIMLVCLLLPSSREDNRRLISSAERTVNDVRGFCQRNPDVCEDARFAMTTILSKLKNGAELVQTWLSKDKNKNGQGDGADALPHPQARPKDAGQPPRLIPKWQDSLSPADKKMPWRGPAPL
ncbi:MAG: DUF5330 domain-containing protein [Rhodomicrobium sp.]|nr:DUF5330 domain-containing protein [Rhodomicrobium sp.]